MTRPDFSNDQSIAAYRAELRSVGRRQRLAGFGLVIAGAILIWLSGQAGAQSQAVLYGGYAALAAGWALMIAAIFLRTRHHRRRMRELD